MIYLIKLKFFKKPPKQTTLQLTQPTSTKQLTMAGYITYKEWDSTHLTGSEPQQKSFANGQISFNQISLFYNYGTNEAPAVSGFYFELPEVKTTGIQTKVESKQGANGPYDKISHSMMIKFDINDPEVVACLRVCDELHRSTCRILHSQKGKVGWHDFDAERPGNSFKSFVYYHRDKITGEKLAGHNPSTWIKLNDYETNRTLFTLPLGEGEETASAIDWTVLRNVELKIIPLLHFERIYIGGKASNQIKLVSAVVTEIHAAGTVSKQVETSEKLRQRRPELADKVAAQLAQLTMDRQDNLATPNYGSMQSIPTETSTNEDMNAFLGAAPPMVQQPTQAQVPPRQQTQPPSQQVQAPPLAQSHVQAPYQPVTLNIPNQSVPISTQVPTQQPTVVRFN